MIDRTKHFWTGDSPEDIAEYLSAFSKIPNLETKPVVCSRCGGNTFTLRTDWNEGAAQAICTGCKAKKLLLDSAEIWEDCSPRPLKCPVCKTRIYNVGAGLHRRESGDLQWVYIGVRCAECGTLGCCVDWEIDYGPTDEMEKNL